MKILLTGNLGYIGSTLTEKLIKEEYYVVGLDSGFYEDCKLTEPLQPNKQLIKDVRKIHLG